jgi:hypothetical protein
VDIRTDAILAAFADVPNEQSAVFRQLLRAVAVCRDGVWTWKED